MVHQSKLKIFFKENLEMFSKILCYSDDLLSSFVNLRISSVVKNKSRKISAYTVN